MAVQRVLHRVPRRGSYPVGRVTITTCSPETWPGSTENAGTAVDRTVMTNVRSASSAHVGWLTTVIPKPSAKRGGAVAAATAGAVGTASAAAATTPASATLDRTFTSAPPVACSAG